VSAPLPLLRCNILDYVALQLNCDLARIPLKWYHLSEKNSRQVNNLEHFLTGKVMQLCRNMLWD
jgi:hypothetical protein